jgi:hypothetical protein
MAYEFNGTNQYLSAGFSPPSGASERTVSCFFNSDSYGDRKIVFYGGTAVIGGEAFAFSLEEISSAPFILFRHNNGNIRYSAQGLSQWQHLTAVVPNGATTTDNVIVYSNGAQQSGVRNAGSNQTLNTSVSNLNIGANLSGGTLFDGLIAELGVWNAALTQPEIASLAKGMACDKVRPQSLVFYAPLARDLIDVRGGTTITNNNTATVANHPRIYQ